MTKHFNKAFTLVEISIVIVIIALLVAGITAGRSVYRSSSLSATITQYQTFKTSVNSFRLQYNALPGDISNAYDYWGSSCDASPNNCNGNGDKIISNSLTEGPPAQESLRAWQHLSLAGILPKGSYTAALDANSFPVVGSGIPKSKYYGTDGEWPTGWSFMPQGVLSMAGFAYWPTDEYRTGVHSDAIIPGDLYMIDKKIDDGIAGKGKVIGYGGKMDIWYWNANCTDASDPSGYKLTYKSNACSSSFYYER